MTRLPPARVRPQVESLDERLAPSALHLLDVRPASGDAPAARVASTTADVPGQRSGPRLRAFRGQIEARVKDLDLNTLPGVRVTLFNEAGKRIATATTNSRGVAVFKNVAEGAYRVAVHAPAFGSASADGVVQRGMGPWRPTLILQ